VDERGALLGVGGCVDTRGLAADSAPVIPVNLSSCTRRSRRQRGRQRFAGGARACWPCRFQGAVRGRTSDYRLPSEPAPALWPVARRSSHSARVFYSSTWAPRLSRWPLLLGVIRLAANARGPRGSGQQWCGACPPAVS